MTVRELIEKLQALPDQDRPVYAEDSDWEPYEVTNIEAKTLQDFSPDATGDIYLLS